MRRQEFIWFLGRSGMSLCRPGSTAWERAKIGWLSSSIPAAAKNLQAFRQSLEHLGHVEGRDIAFEFRYADHNFDRPPRLAAELVEQKVDIIATVSSTAAEAARRATSTIPIVAISLTDPVGRGLVESLARPGGNVTGLTLSVGLDLYSKSMELLKEAVPGLQMVALLVNPTSATHTVVASQIEAATQVLKVRAGVFQTRRSEETQQPLKRLRKPTMELCSLSRIHCSFLKPHRSRNLH
jgi:putative ABC transport system substrate-binding protein